MLYAVLDLDAGILLSVEQRTETCKNALIPCPLFSSTSVIVRARFYKRYISFMIIFIWGTFLFNTVFVCFFFTVFPYNIISLPHIIIFISYSETVISCEESKEHVYYFLVLNYQFWPRYLVHPLMSFGWMKEWMKKSTRKTRKLTSLIQQKTLSTSATDEKKSRLSNTTGELFHWTPEAMDTLKQTWIAQQVWKVVSHILHNEGNTISEQWRSFKHYS